MNEEITNHLGGVGVIVRTYYADPDNKGKANVYTSLPDELELELWQEAAFTNGGPLVRIELLWAPEEAKQLVGDAASESSETD